MRRLFWIGSPFFQHALAACGWETAFFNFEDHRFFGWEDIVRHAGFVPDVVVVADKSRAPFVLGVEDFPCLTVFYSVDSHIHSWQSYYAQGFDACLVSLHDHCSRFEGQELPSERIWWSPAFAPDTVIPYQDVSPLYDCLFVGTVNSNLPRRQAFLQAFAQKFPRLHVCRGDYKKIFPQGRVLLNQCEHGDLNFRVFEAMGCGGCLLTPQIGHGLTKLFADGVELQTYTDGDVDDAVQKLRSLLAEPERIVAMQHAALHAINTGHRASHRALQFTQQMQSLLEHSAECIQQRRARAAIIREQYLKIIYLLWASESEQPAVRAVYRAAAHGQFLSSRE